MLTAPLLALLVLSLATLSSTFLIPRLPASSRQLPRRIPLPRKVLQPVKLFGDLFGASSFLRPGASIFLKHSNTKLVLLDQNEDGTWKVEKFDGDEDGDFTSDGIYDYEEDELMNMIMGQSGARVIHSTGSGADPLDELFGGSSLFNFFGGPSREKRASGGPLDDFFGQIFSGGRAARSSGGSGKSAAAAGRRDGGNAAKMRGLREAEKQKAARVESQLSKGRALLEKGSDWAAHREFTIALQLDGQNPAAHDGLAQIYARLGQADNAKEHAQQAAALKDQRVSLLCETAQRLWDGGLREAAASLCAQAVALAPEHPAAAQLFAALTGAAPTPDAPAAPEKKAATSKAEKAGGRKGAASEKSAAAAPASSSEDLMAEIRGQLDETVRKLLEERGSRTKLTHEAVMQTLLAELGRRFEADNLRSLDAAEQKRAAFHVVLDGLQQLLSEEERQQP